MIIKLPKPTCPECKSDNIRVYSDNYAFECNNCMHEEEINIIWEDEQTFCTCDLCKKLMVDKESEVN